VDFLDIGDSPRVWLCRKRQPIFLHQGRWKKYNAAASILRHPLLRQAPIALQVAEVMAR
jgi:hypothetical protein